MVGGVKLKVFTVGVPHVTGAPVGSRTVQAIDPAGAGLPVGPTAVAVRVIEPPRVGAPLYVRVNVGDKIETMSVTVFEVTAV